MKKIDIYALACDNYATLSKSELFELLKETAFKLWDNLDDDERYFETCENIIENVDENLFDLIG